MDKKFIKLEDTEVSISKYVLSDIEAENKALKEKVKNYKIIIDKLENKIKQLQTFANNRPCLQKYV